MEQKNTGNKIIIGIIEENFSGFNKILSSTLKCSINVQQNKYRKAHSDTHNQNFIIVVIKA